MPSTHPVVSVSGLTVTWPDGSPALRDLDLALSRGRAGLVRANGSGKSTLLRVPAGQLRPCAGRVAIHGEVGYLPQDLDADPSRPVADFLGVSAIIAALRAIEAGRSDEELYGTVADQWDVEERTHAELDRQGLPAGALHRRLGELSGGELTGLAIARPLLARPDVLLLDEPTNNLDRAGRGRVHDLVATWPRTLLVVSHDRELLDRVDRIADLRGGSLRWYGGGWSSYAAQVAAEQEAAQQAVATVRNEVRRQRRDAVEAVRDDLAIRVDLPQTAVPRGSRVLTHTETDRDIVGPERIALVGPNGSGKTTLLRTWAGLVPPARGEVHAHVPVALLPQRLDLLDADAPLATAVARRHPGAGPEQVRARLARFGFRGAVGDRLAGDLSGGERLRATLAALLLTEPAPRLLLLDEPTNNLDLASYDALVAALAGYRGALVVASHDRALLDDLDLQRTIDLGAPSSGRGSLDA
ncbi:ATPase subunit of ABC transporter with duplicated ATPase domains [Nocardioides salarius]|uniref:ATPase subunit of ABC transporter with duplicated ATPase domains n=1 Tax=Nocardioides salarius TaxID=374513 RepID=A0ABS2M713_9ACTN|nr:ATP-binding cassette domain-containing protein [Nocardioides salarius]MBM7506983.1 ATPase subunit of ABC transporter with duplicated ATPase domains [Nocardioides salarius]